MKKCIFLSVFCILYVVLYADDTLTVVMHQMKDIEVSATRVQQTTLSTVVVSNEDLNRDNTGQNLPYLLTTTPGWCKTFVVGQ